MRIRIPKFDFKRQGKRLKKIVKFDYNMMYM